MALPRECLEKSRVKNQIFRRIRIREQYRDRALEMESEGGLNPVVSRILAARGFRSGEALKNFLSPSLREGLPDPKCLKNLDAACKLVRQCKESGKGIAIACDFDVDGLSGGSLVFDFLGALGIYAKVFVPDRFVDGYGLNERMIRSMAEEGLGLLITVDFGTTNSAELTLARSLGLKTIVVDHHHMKGEPPCADVFINPHQDGCGFADKTMCAAGLAWYLAIGLKQEFDSKDLDVRRFLDLACLGTICDMVPLIGPNRVIAKRGLEMLAQNARAGVQALKFLAGFKKDLSCSDISFGIGPRLNAAGRIVHGSMVVELLTTRDRARAESVAAQLNQLNIERQEVEARVKEAAIRIVEERGGPDAGLVVWNPEFHTGVIGIVAQRLVETYYRPSAVLGVDTQGIFKGSVRGIKGVSVIDLLTSLQEYLIKFGGHEGAGGFSIKEEQLEPFRAAFVSECTERLRGVEASPFVDADTEILLKEFTPQLVEGCKVLAPFGVGNPAPIVVLRNMRVAQVKELKSTHLKVVFSDGDRFVTGILWRQTSHPAVQLNRRVTVAFRPEINAYMGSTELQANIQAVEAAG